MSRLINQRGRVFSSRLGQDVQFDHVTSSVVHGQPKETLEAFTARAIVQPAGKDNLELLPEGERFKPAMLIHISTPLNVGDYMNYDGKRWRVVNCQNWSAYGFYQCIAIEYGGTEDINHTGFTVT